MLSNTQRKKLGFAILLLALAPFWTRFIAPQLTKMPANFSYTADIVSLDNFYDPSAKKFSGEQRSVTKFSYGVAGAENGMLTIKNSFDVRKPGGDTIYSVDRLYGIDAATGKHVSGYGDENREGYLFAPRHLKQREDFTYWHVNYDGPAHMVFAGQDTIAGLTVYRYETRYAGVRITQAANPALLPSGEKSLGIELEPYLQLWIEPVSGHLVKYSDDTVAYYYDLRNGKRLFPWNHFQNAFSLESVLQQVGDAKRENFFILLLDVFMPKAFMIFAFALVLCAFLNKGKLTCIFMRFLAAVALAVLWIWLSSAAKPARLYSGPVEHIRIAAEAGLLSSPIWIAEHKGYFAEEGLDAEIKQFNSGRAAFGALLREGDIDIATVAQTPIVTQSFLRHDFEIVAGMVHSTDDVKVIGRRDRGIVDGRSLRGKRIGMTKGTAGHYFLSLFLAQNGLQLSDVTTVDYEPDALPEAISSGAVDAISTWGTYGDRSLSMLGKNGIALSSEGTFREDFYLTSFHDWIEKHPDLLKRFLSALSKAERYISEHPKESRRIVAERLRLDPASVSEVWGRYHFALFLDQAILLSLEQQARWMVANGFAHASLPMNFLTVVNTEILGSLEPQSVSIIR